MSANTPIIKTHDIPIEDKPRQPLALPTPDPRRWITVGIPIKEPVKVEV